MEEIFGNSIDLEKGKPTNQEFLLTIVEQITKKGWIDKKRKNDILILENMWGGYSLWNEK